MVTRVVRLVYPFFRLKYSLFIFPVPLCRFKNKTHHGGSCAYAYVSIFIGQKPVCVSLCTKTRQERKHESREGIGRVKYSEMRRSKMRKGKNTEK